MSMYLDGTDMSGSLCRGRHQDSRGTVVVERVLEVIVVNSVHGWLCFLFTRGQKHLLSFTWTQFIEDVVGVLLLALWHTVSAGWSSFPQFIH